MDSQHTRDATWPAVLDRLRALHPESSGRRLKQWLAEGRVRVNGRVVRDGRVAVGPGDVVALEAHGEPVFPTPLRRIHEDDQLLVIDKPPGLLTIATEQERERTAYRLLWAYLSRAHPPRRPFVVHRLDRDTSGLLVVAKSPPTKQALQAQFEGRRVERVYEAVVEGTVQADRGTLDTRLVEDRSLRVRSAGGDVAPGRRAGPGPARGRRGRPDARQAITHFRVLERRPGATRLELRLETGRRHQIRVQLAEMGHPIVGDRTHGSRTDPLHRLCLHATRLGFLHPATQRLVIFESPAPRAFTRVGLRPTPGGRGSRGPVA